MRFTVRDLLWLAVALGLGVTLFLNHRELKRLEDDRSQLVTDGFVQGAEHARLWWKEKVELIEDPMLKSIFQRHVDEQPVFGDYTLPEDRKLEHPPLRSFGIVQ